MILTQEQIDKVSCIPTEEVEQDKQLTQNEIDQLEKELSILSINKSSNRLEIMKREVGIKDRKDFIQSLDCVLNYRKNKGNKI